MAFGTLPRKTRKIFFPIYGGILTPISPWKFEIGFLMRIPVLTKSGSGIDNPSLVTANLYICPALGQNTPK
jgi:hypothetical protein